jgi:hypothetical protein
MNNSFKISAQLGVGAFMATSTEQTAANFKLSAESAAADWHDTSWQTSAIEV